MEGQLCRRALRYRKVELRRFDAAFSEISIQNVIINVIYVLVYFIFFFSSRFCSFSMLSMFSEFPGSSILYNHCAFVSVNLSANSQLPSVSYSFRESLGEITLIIFGLVLAVS